MYNDIGDISLACRNVCFSVAFALGLEAIFKRFMSTMLS